MSDRKRRAVGEAKAPVGPARARPGSGVEKRKKRPPTPKPRIIEAGSQDAAKTPTVKAEQKASGQTRSSKSQAAKPPAASAARIPGRQPDKIDSAKDPITRGLKQHVRTANKRSLASTLWLERQLNDPYVARARAEGWRSRSAFKLIEIDDRFRLLRPGQRIVDLGAAPGGWAQVAARRVGASDDSEGQPLPADPRLKRGAIVGIDLLEMDAIPGVRLAVMDFTDDDAPVRLRAMLDPGGLGLLADGVISDMAANTTGHRKTDHLRIASLAEMVADFAREVLAPGGFMLTKLFQGGETSSLVVGLKRDFTVIRHVKPAASRADSSELYLLATGYRGLKTSRGDGQDQDDQ